MTDDAPRAAPTPGRPPAAGPDGSHGPHAFVADLAAPELDDHDRHHFARVVRLRPGDALTVSDGAGAWRECRFGDRLEPVGDIRTVEPLQPAISVAFALVKGERPEWVVQKLTELGVDRVIPFAAARSVVRWDDRKADQNHVRLAKVAREAAMQSRRCFLPTVDRLATFAEVAAQPGAVLAERGGGPLRIERPLLLVGPEGGWSDDERAGRPTAALGVQVLRAETAAVAGATILTALRAGLVAPR